jgi:alpha-ribazole phosphatase/probable phosphoglycerate mutase
MTRLALIRHGEPSEDSHGRCYGALDLELSPAGREQAELLAAALAPTPLAAIYASPRRRTLDTAAPLAAAHGLRPIVDARLSEIDFGDFEGRSYEEIERSYPDSYQQWMATPTLVRFPGGESFADLRERVLAALAEIRARHASETVAIFSHGGVLRTILAACLEMPAEAVFRLEQSYAAISVVDWVEGLPIVRLVNAQAASVAATGGGLLAALSDRASPARIKR